MRPLLTLTLGLALLTTAASSRAQSGPPPGKSVQWTLGAGVVAAPRPFEGADAEFFPVPIVGVRAGAFYFQTVRMGVRVVNEDHFEMDVLAQARFDGREADDAPILVGTHERRMSADGGVRLGGKWKHVETELLALTDVLSRHSGSEVTLTVGFPWTTDGWTVTPGLGARWQTENLVDYYFGVEADEAMAGRPAYEAGEAMNPRVRVEVRKPFADAKWTFLAQLTHEWLDGEIRHSPIVDASSTLGGYFAFLRTF